ncbi:receptor like protein 54 [Raphanus sativus]|nr:receptor like protein 54 [Raphanus sativus]
MVKPCSHVSSNCSFFCCLFVSSFFVNSFFSLPFPRSEQIEFLLAFKNEFPILKCDFRDSKQKTNSWTSKDVESFDGVFFDYETGAVTKLDLRAACLSGTLSANSSLFRLHQLRYLDLSSNSFDSFSFLPELGKLTDLEVLHLSYMGLSGEIPSSFSSLNRLTELDLSNNEFVGSFSPLLNLSRLSYLYLSNNLFSGCVPCSLLTTMPFLSYLNLGENHFTDSVETLNCSSSSSSNLETLYLNYNHLSGRILEPLSKLTNLKKLYISYQNTTDPINFVSSGFKSLEELDLSGNAISRLNISYSNLKGTQFGGQPKSSFEGNLNLCGRPLDHSCFRDKAPEAQESEPSKQEQVLNWKAAAMGYGPGVLFGLAVGQVIYSYKPVLFYKLFRL